LKVTELEDVAQPDQPWSEQGVNVCLAGNFNQVAPPLAQLDAAGRLCAWLAQNLGLTADAIVGLGDLIRTDSPGDTFYRGPAWKEVLARQVRLHLAALGMGAVDSGRLQELEEVIAAQRRQNGELASQAQAAGSQAAQLQAQVDALQVELLTVRRRLESEPEVLEGGLRVHLVAGKLPRTTNRYVARQAADIVHIVINHTGAPPETDLAELARIHRAEWPGILYDFVVDTHGAIFQTQPLDEVADTSEPYVRNAVNVALAGDFRGTQAPSPEQLAAAGRLIGWLLDRYPQLTLESVRGLRDFVATESPGEQWESGRRWKRALLAATGRMSVGTDPALERELRARVETLDRDLRETEAARLAAAEEQLSLREEVQRLRTALDASTAAVSSFVVPPPPLRVVVDQLPKHPTLRFARRAVSQITHIAIHHTAAPPRVGPARIAELHIAADPGRGKEAWPGIGYHFFVHEDGTVEQTNYLETASYHLFRHYGYAVGVVFAGSFMNGKIPSSAQLRAGAHLVAWLMQDLKVPLARVWGHREFPDNMTVCPGGEWTQGNRWRDLLFERIEQVQQGTGLKTTRHYMLFWNRDEGSQSGRDDFVNAMGYIARFQPTVGFSVEEARTAEYVTIVGGEAGVSAVAEQQLLQAGCKVERIAGREAMETGRLLAELVRVGRRFRIFDVDF
jgi:N-acetyl-anhydromuramyl-L-alanine amidase AmpD